MPIIPNRNPRLALALCLALTPIFLGGCNPAQPASSAVDRANRDAPPEVSEARTVAEAALGKQAEVLAHGDLARDGFEQVLAVNREVQPPGTKAMAARPAAIAIVRAAILEKRDGKWAEVLRCDERLKNPSGYLAGSPAERVSGWRLEYHPDAGQGLEMNFTPAGVGDSAGQSILVRWNTRVKRYQSLEASHKRFLNELPTLETPSSFLK